MAERYPNYLPERLILVSKQTIWANELPTRTMGELLVTTRPNNIISKLSQVYTYPNYAAGERLNYLPTRTIWDDTKKRFY